MFDERADATQVTEVVGFIVALVRDLNADTRVQERELSQAFRQDVKRVLNRRKDIGVGGKGNCGAGVAGFANVYERGHWNAAFVMLFPCPAAATD